MLKLHARTMNEVGRGDDRTLLEAAAALADLALAEAAPLRAEPRTLDHYTKLRDDLLRPYLELGLRSHACALAEKFGAHAALVEACVRACDYAALRDYLLKHEREGMPEVAFSWLYSRGPGSQALLIRELGSSWSERLEAWLAAEPARVRLLALHQLGAGRAAAAANTLADIAARDNKYLSRMITTASLGKLCALAADDQSDDLAVAQRALDLRLLVGEQQAGVPRDLLKRHDLLSEGARVLSPDEIVQIYTEDENDKLTEYDYKKALDLVELIEEPELREHLRLKVWVRAVGRDRALWAAGVDGVRDEEGAEGALARYTFCRLAELVRLMDEEQQAWTPPLDALLEARELVDVAREPRAHHALKFAYRALALPERAAAVC